MQRINYPFLVLLAAFTFILNSCEVIGGIFKAGVWTGLIIVAVVVAIVIWIIAKVMK